MICKNSHKCKDTDCLHRKHHEYRNNFDDDCDAPCDVPEGIPDSICKETPDDN